MAAFVKGDVVIVPFPFSDLSNAKRRPALVVASLARQDLILCMITSQSSSDQYITPSLIEILSQVRSTEIAMSKPTVYSQLTKELSLIELAPWHLTKLMR